MLSDEQIYECEDAAGKSYRRHKYSVRGQQITPADDPYWHFARAIEAEVRKDYEAEIAALKSDLYSYMTAANAEGTLAMELMEKRKQDEALIRQLVEALEESETPICDFGPAYTFAEKRRESAIALARARLEGKP